MRRIFLFTLIGLGFLSSSVGATGVYNGQVANPFVFCSLPKPCKKWCQPWRSIWEQICPAGQLSAQDRQAYEQGKQEMLKTNPELVNQAMTADIFRREMGKANLSAFSEDDQYTKEVSEWINYQGNQVSNGRLVSDIWCEQGIANPQGYMDLRQMAYRDIVLKNQKIVELISNGTIPPKNLKPWYDYQGRVGSCKFSITKGR